MLDLLTDFLFPPHCPVCHAYVERTGQWCPECLAATLKPCAIAMHEATDEVVDSAWALGRYEGPLGTLIKDFKYHGRRDNLSYIEKFLTAANGSLGHLPQAVVAVPVPLHKERERLRGFNQAEVIFQDWLLSHGIPMERLLERVVNTTPQYQLSSAERQTNLQNAFALAEGAAVEGKDILLVDDIMTTGATARECAIALKAAGATSVHVLVLAAPDLPNSI